MPDVLDPPLTRIDGVELARVGSWGTMLGKWDAKADDFAAAIEAAQCPATRAPIVKLGHLDRRFTPHDSMPTFDGTPSIGWVENLRVEGDVLLGDFAGVPQWLRTVAASAFPNRSIEAAYNRRCALGHVHPFSVGAVALLGVTPPGVDSLRSLNDIPALFGIGIAAAGCADLDAGQVVVATIGDIAAGRHSAPVDFTENLHPRDGWGRFATGGGGPTPPPPLRATDGRDRLGLAGRMDLGQGETLASSASVAASDSDIGVAWVNGESGPGLRLGLALQGTGDWTGAPDATTASLDAHGIARLAQASAAAQDAVTRGQQLLRETDRHIDDLEGERRDLQRRQHPDPSRAQARQVDRLDRQITDLDSRIASRSRSQQAGNAELPAPARAEYDRLDAEATRLRAAGGADADQRIADIRRQQADLHAQREDPNQPAGYATLAHERLGQIDQATAQRADLVAQRDALLGAAVPLSDADTAELARVNAEIQQAESDRADLVDGEVLRGGIVPGSNGDLVYEVSLDANGEPQIRLEVRPSDAGADWRLGESGTESTLTKSEFMKLVKLLAAGVTSDVAAAAPDTTGDAAVHTGAMVALIPSAEDAARLAVDGGEPVGELHCTLMYLGDADQIPDKVRARLVAEVSRAVNGYPPVEADAFAVSMFNPTGDEPCAVYGICGQMADDVHMLIQTVVMETSANTMLDLPDQHQPWVAHVTALYTPDLARLAELVGRVGPVVFDRVRVVFGGDATDIPLTALGYDDAAWNAAPMDASGWADDMVAAAGGDKNKVDREQLKRYWTKDPKGLAKWAKSPHPWRALYGHLKKFMDPEMAKRVTSQWFHDTLGRWPGQKDGGKKVAASDPPQSGIADPPTESEPTTPPPGGVSVSPQTPGAEPEPTTEPKEGDLVSTLSTDVRSRLGLADDADDAAVVAALDALKTKAETPPPVAPDPELVAASAAATAAVAEYRTELQRVTAELAEIKVAASADAKRSLFEGWQGSGRISPAEREEWEGRYDKAPEVIADILNSRPASFAVPVAASGHTGTGEEVVGDDDAEYDRLVASIDGPYARKAA